MSEPLDLEPIKELMEQVPPLLREIATAYLQVCEERDRLRDEIAERAIVEADLRAQLAEAKAKIDDPPGTEW